MMNQEVTEKVPAKVISETIKFKCTQWETSFKSEKGLNIHVGKTHKKEELPTPEKERVSSAEGELSLNLTPTWECREEPDNTEPIIFILRKGCDTKTCMKNVNGIDEMVKALATANFYNNGCFSDICNNSFSRGISLVQGF